MRSTHLPILTTVALLAVIGGVHCGGGSTSPTAPTPPTTSSSGTQPAVSADLPVAAGSLTPGLYQDGLGTYPPRDEVYLSPDGRSLFVRPLCPGSSQATPRTLDLVLPPATREVVAGRLSTCVDLALAGRGEGIFLHLPSPLTRQTGAGAIVGAGGASPNADTRESIFLSFNVDSNGDGTIRVPPDDQYNIRWQRGIYLKQRSETAATTVYALTSLATEFGPDLSCHAELILRNTPLGEISKGIHCLSLVVTFTVEK